MTNKGNQTSWPAPSPYKKALDQQLSSMYNHMVINERVALMAIDIPTPVFVAIADPVARHGREPEHS